MRKITRLTRIKIIVAVVFVVAFLITMFFVLYPTVKMSNYDKYFASLEKQKTTYGMQSLKNRNSDFVAWLECKDVNVSIPIVCSNNDYYLDHDFDKSSNALGSPYHYNTSTIGESSNTTIIGHSAYNTTSFNGKLVCQAVMGNFSNYVDTPNSSTYNYKITIEAMSQTYTYQIFSVFTFNSNADYTNELKLFNTTNLDTQQEFNNYVNSAKSLSIKNFNQTASFGDKFITLYTCSFTSGYRIMIIAKQI